MNTERRTGKDPIPKNPERLLSDTQVLALHQIENFGWHLEFMRRPLFQDPVAVVINADRTQMGVLEEDGRINMEPDIKIRTQ
jgi:hypothetical protein